MGGSSKRGGKTPIIGYDYYASFAGLAGMGPADALLELIVEGTSAWKPASPVLRSASANPYVFTVSSTPSEGADKSYEGRVYFYWGTPTQTLSDPVLTKPGRIHPPYRRRVLVVFEDFFCGFERDSVPNVQVVYRREADQAIVTASLQAGQANPLAVAAEWLTNPVTGIGLPAERLDAASWQAVANDLAAEAATEYLSVLVTSAQSLNDLLGRLAEYADVWFRIGLDGQIEAGRALIGAEPDGLPVLTYHALTEPPQIEAAEPGELPDRVNLKYTSESHAYEERIARFDDPLGRIAEDGERDREYSMDWIVRDAQASAKVAQLGERDAQPYWQASLSVRFATWWALGLRVGDPFVLDYAPLSFRAVMRAEQVNGFASGGGSIQVRAVSERRLRPGVASGAADATPTAPTDTLADFAHVHLLQAPSVAADGEPYSLIALIGQDSRITRQAMLYWRLPGSAAFSLLGSLAGFAAPVQLAAALSDSGPDDDETGGILIAQYDPAPLGFDDLPGTQSDEEILADNLLLIVIDATDTHRFESLTVKSIESPTGSDYPVFALRGRQGTAKQAFASGSPAYLVFRSRLVPFSHAAFETVAQGATAPDRTIYLKAQPVARSGGLDLADVAERSLELRPQLTDALILDGDAAV